MVAYKSKIRYIMKNKDTSSTTFLTIILIVNAFMLELFLVIFIVDYFMFWATPVPLDIKGSWPSFTSEVVEFWLPKSFMCSNERAHDEYFVYLCIRTEDSSHIMYKQWLKIKPNYDLILEYICIIYVNFDLGENIKCILNYIVYTISSRSLKLSHFLWLFF